MHVSSMESKQIAVETGPDQPQDPKSLGKPPPLIYEDRSLF